jgi:hypothetical protein
MFRQTGRRRLWYAAALSIALAWTACGSRAPALTASPAPAAATLSSPASATVAGFAITGALSASITWDTDLPPNCYVTTTGDGSRAFFFGVVAPREYQLYASIYPFDGPGNYDAASRPASIGGFDWRDRAVTVFNLGDDKAERWLATGGKFTVTSADDDSATGSISIDLAPAGAHAAGPIHVEGQWACLHTGN